MDEQKALTFVPKSTFGGYHVAVKIVHSGDQYRAYMVPVPGENYYLAEDLQYLMGLDEPRRFPFEVNGVLIKGSQVPENELEFIKHRQILSFNEALEFLSSISGFKRV